MKAVLLSMFIFISQQSSLHGFRRSVFSPSKLKCLMLADLNDFGYGPFISLILEGPIPFFVRLTNPDNYEGAVKKIMSDKKCDRFSAQRSIDSYYKVMTSNKSYYILCP